MINCRSKKATSTAKMNKNYDPEHALGPRSVPTLIKLSVFGRLCGLCDVYLIGCRTALM
jgi:hypothetical protein